MDLTSDELTDARLAVATLLSARNDGDTEAEDAILGTASQRRLAAIAKTLLDSHHDELLRLHVASALMTEQQKASVFDPEYHDLASDPVLRGRVAGSLVDVHDDIPDE